MGKEKRYFRRYKRRVSFNISYNGKKLDAVALDYSISGIGALMEKGPQLPEELDLNIKLHNQPVQMYGRVAWKKETSDGMRVGIELVGPIQGSLEVFMLSDLLIGLQRTKKIGTLEITSSSLIKKVYIKNGDMIFASSNLDEDRFGDMLLSERRITSDQYERSVRHMEQTGKQQGAALVELGYLKPHDLFVALKYQVEKIIIDLFKLETGIFHFREGPLPVDEVIKLNFSAANLIYKGIKDIKDADVIQGFFPSFKTVLRLSPDPLDLFQDIMLNADDRSVLAYVDGKSTIDNILSLSPLDKLEVLKILYMLLSASIIVDVSEFEPEEFEDDVDLVAEVIEEAKETVGEQKVEEPEEFIQKVDELYSKLGNIGYYEILGLKEDASLSEIKKTYYKMAKDFHPDKHFYLDTDMKGKLSLIFSYITSAYSTISNPQMRQDYDKEKKDDPDKHASGVVTAQDKFDQGIAEMNKRNYADAAELFGQAGYMNNKEPEYSYYYGLSLYRLGKLKEAESEMRKAIKIDPVNAEYLAEIGHVYLELGFPLRAKGNFERALKIEPKNPRALEGVASLPADLR
jgi:tetratricopeptide (TPR) repeat protein